VIGDLRFLRRQADQLGLSVPLLPAASDGRLASAGSDAIPVIDCRNVGENDQVGRVSAAAGAASWEYIEHGVRLCLDGLADVLVTAPINKQALEAANLGHQGHTEMLQELTGSSWSQTLFTGGGLTVLFYSRHISLRDAIGAITADGIVTTLQRFSEAAPALGMPAPRIGVAALNPHAGEAGLFGDEEIVHIAPGVKAARRLGIDVVGPIPADSIFHQAREGRFDVVLSLYHDQVASVVKTLDFHGTVSLTLGLPFLRLSVDHGTAHDIAGRNLADSRNMECTLAMAASVASA